VDSAVHSAVHSAVRSAVRSAVHSAVDSAVDSAVPDLWWRYIGGQFWAGWYWYGPSGILCFIDLLRLDLGREMELRARAYAATATSACWWWPHRDFVCVSERPRRLVVANKKLVCAEWEGWSVKP
jgi:hypothetical protein